MNSLPRFELQRSRISALSLTNFRNYSEQQIAVSALGDPNAQAAPNANPADAAHLVQAEGGEGGNSQGNSGGDIIALVGPNGAGKTNVLEAISLLSPGRGLRGSQWQEFARQGHGDGAFAVSAKVDTAIGARQLGLGRQANSDKRQYRLDGAPCRSANAFAEFLAFVWLSPQQDGLFRGAAEERRRFIDQLATALDANYAGEWSAYQNSARQRLKLLKQAAASGQTADPTWLSALEDSMARHATTVAVARRAMIRQLSALAQKGHAPFPGAHLGVEGFAEEALDTKAAVQVEDDLRALWREERPFDQRYGRTHTGPHRSDFVAWHSDHAMPAKNCSTGEQKAMLIAILLSHATLIENQRMVRPILLLDEATAHLDPPRRVALLEVLVRFGGQCWLTGTDLGAFPGLDRSSRGVQILTVEQGRVWPLEK